MIESLNTLAVNAGHRSLTDIGNDGPVGINDPRMSLDQLFEFAGGGRTYSGKLINEHTALNLSGVFGATRIIANGIAQQTLYTMRRLDETRQERATDHYLYPLFKDSLGQHWTAFRFKRFMITQAVLRGNAIATYETSPNGRVFNIEPISMDRVTFNPQRDGSLRYGIQQLDANGQPSGTILEYSSNHVFHLRGLESSDNGIGLSVVRLAREAIGLGLATEEYGAKLFSNGALMSGYIKYPGRLSPAARGNIEDSFKLRAGAGNRNAHGTPVFEEGMEFVKVSIDPADAEFLASRKFTILEICRWFGVKPHMLAELDGATHSNIEQESIEHVRDCLGPWMDNFTSELAHTFLSPMERKSIFFMFDSTPLLRGDMLSRYQAYGTGIQNAILTPDEARVYEGRNPVPYGDQLLVNGTMIPLSVAATKTEPTPAAGTPAAAKQNNQEDTGNEA